MQVILGSASPRRKEILHFFTLPFKQIPSQFEEESVPLSDDPVKYAKILSEEKGKRLAQKYPNDVIITADTVVYSHGKIYNKPTSAKEAMKYLEEFSGNWSEVITAVTVCKGKQQVSEVEKTRILFHPLSKKQIKQYHEHCFFSDKAGGFAVENCGSIILEKIDGCFYNILGLPINALRKALLHVNIDLWDFLRRENENS